MIRYLTAPLLAMFALGLGAGWTQRAGRSMPRDVWDDAAWWGKGFGYGLTIRRLDREDVTKVCPAAASQVRVIDTFRDGKDVSISFKDGSAFWGQVRIIPSGHCDADSVCRRPGPFVAVQYQSPDECRKECLESP